MSRHGLSALAAVACFLLGNQISFGASAKDIMRALDLEDVPGIELVRQEFIKYKYDEGGWIETDENGDNVIDSYSKSSKWDVQKGNWGKQGLYPGVSPLMGESCVRSGIGTECKESNDAQSTRLVFKVTSGGILRYSCLTACDSSDGVNVYVDGQLENQHFESFGLDNVWGKDPDDPESELGTFEIEITGGLAPEGSAYAGTYDHEVIFEFYKDDPNFEWGDNDKPHYQSSDEPVKPSKEDYTWDGVFDKEGYEYALADEYYSFRNSAWLDKFQWVPTNLEIQIGFGDVTTTLELVDHDGILLSNNALDYGYSIRYTLDGTEPTETSPLYVQSADDEQAIDIERSCTITAMVFDKLNQPLKQTLVRRQVVVKASKPVLTIERMSDDEVLVSMASAYSKNEIRYTLNGAAPTGTSTRYDAWVSVKKPLTVKAISAREGIVPSEAVELVIEQAAQPTNLVVRNGRFEEPSHIYTDEDGLEVSCDQLPGVELLYSVDRAPWKLFTGPVPVKARPGTTKATVAFRNRAEGKLASEILETTIFKADEEWMVNGDADAENALRLADGWSLMGMPVSMPSSQEDFLLEQFRFFRFNSLSESYEQVGDLEEGRAYWVFKSSKQAMQMMLKGTQKGGVALEELQPGWHGYAADKNGQVPDGIMAWKFVNGRYEPAMSFERGKGYFIFKAE